MGERVFRHLPLPLPAARAFLLIAASAAIVLIAAQKAEPPAEEGLTSIVNRAAAYYQRLDQMSAYYFCRETVLETIYPIPRKHLAAAFPRDGSNDGWAKIHLKGLRSSEFVYDYQMLRHGKDFKERRNLIREDGKEKLVKDASLETSLFNYEVISLGPIAFAQDELENYDFKLLGTEPIMGRKALVVESKPRFGGGGSQLIWGKYWIDSETAGFLRVEMAQQSILNFAVLERIALRLQATPQITMAVDYGVERSGIRFPSRFFLEEGYVGGDGGRMVLSSLEVTYDEYRFFRVDVEVKEKR